jgi:superfamily I DNA/RNA helicase
VAIGRRIEEMVGGTGFYSVDFGKTDESGETGDRAFSDFAVLCRTHQLAQGIAAVLEGAGIPCQLASRKAFWDGKGIQELLALFRLLRDPAGLCDLQRIATLPGIGPGKPAMERFKNACHQGELSMAQALSVLSQGETLPGVDKRTFYRFKDFLYQLRQLDAQMPGGGIRGKLDFLVKAAGLRSIIPRTPEADTALHRLFELAYGFGDDINGFLRTLALQTDPDLYAPRAQKVAVMTLHAAKGLEFPVVFVAGCEHGFLPFVRSPEEAPDMEEERRLFFVAMTRAKEQLFLSHADKRTVYGKTVKRAISPFVSAIKEDLLSRIKANPPKSPQKKGARQMDLFD